MVKPTGISDNSEGLANDDPPLKERCLKCDDFGAARRALYAARAQLD